MSWFKAELRLLNDEWVNESMVKLRHLALSQARDTSIKSLRDSSEPNKCNLSGPNKSWCIKKSEIIKVE